MSLAQTKPEFSASRDQGFTLIELLVVIGILSLLVTAFFPSIQGALGMGEQAETRARITFLMTAAQAFEKKTGQYPPDNGERLTFPKSGKNSYPGKLKTNGVNDGIECLVAMLHWRKIGGVTFEDKEDWFANTDADQNGSVIHKMDRTDLVEVVDAWGTPLAYFRASDGYTKRSQRIALGLEGDGEQILAKPVANPETLSSFKGKGMFQIISAGADLIFGTEDDIMWPEKP